MRDINEGNEVTRLREISPDEVELIPEGNLGREDMADFQAWLDRALQGGHRTIALNFEDVGSISSSAIGKILHFKKTCDEMGRRLVIRNCDTQMLQLLKMIKFDALIEIEP
ncbi:MAG: STAS domain-containing protein [Spirochaetia bacterium]|jgi:anti-anti-sigma factor